MDKKQIIKIFTTISTLLLTLLMLVMIIKPGAAVFYMKTGLDSESADFSGGTIIYPLNRSDNFYNRDTILVRSGGQLFPRIKTEELPSRVDPAFAVEEVDPGQYIVRIVTGADMAEDIDLSQYQILIRPRFITQNWFRFLGVSLAVGFVLSAVSILLNSELRKKLFNCGWGFLNLWDHGDPVLESIKGKTKVLFYALRQGIFVAYFYTFMEWLFFITKPSFMDILALGEKTSVFIISGFGIWILIAGLIVIIFLLDSVFTTFLAPYGKFVYYLPATLLLTGLVLILVDNFTYTVFKFGVSTVPGWARGIYVVGLVVVFGLVIRSFIKKFNAQDQKPRQRINNWVGGSILLISFVVLAINFQPLNSHLTDLGQDQELRTPNIILISDDGLNAENMSLYGYERETTPFLDSLAPDSLLMMNNFTNANTSSGSDTALLTGKSPFDTMVMYPPNTLEGTDTLEHLPAILRKLGYRNISFGVPHYVDVGVINFQNGFDAVNGEEVRSLAIFSKASSYGYNDSVYFVESMVERLTSRVLHVLFIKDMGNAYLQLMEPSPSEIYLNLNSTYNLLLENVQQANEAGQPHFAHIHLLTTHGSKFHPENPVFSAGQEQNNHWMVDFYDDAILEYDQWLQELIASLKANGNYENTVLVFYTDHGERWSAQVRTPLMIHFPGDEYAGEQAANSQNMDIAPTILDYVGVDQPEWMTGRSLLGEIERNRVIYVAEIDGGLISGGALEKDAISPPFYHFGYINVIQCQYLYEIKLNTGAMERKLIPAYVQPCADEDLDEPYDLWADAMDYLRSYGYQIPEGWDVPVAYSEE